MIVVSDTSPISNLIQIGRFELLGQLFNEVIVPPFVHNEILALAHFNIDLTSYNQASWLRIQQPKNNVSVQNLLKVLDRGEAEAITLAKELNANLLLIDERIGTKKAREIGLNTIGLLGLLIDAKTQKLIPEVKLILTELEQVGFYIKPQLKIRILNMANETP